MRSLVGESFDMFGRYSAASHVRHRYFDDAPIRVLDVGDPFGTIGRVLPLDHTVSVDLFADPQSAVQDHVRLLGSGLSLPFPDASFDLVTTHDTLEHLPADARQAFVDELLRVSAGPVLLIAPFADDRTERCEQLVNLYFVARLGHELAPLTEHAEFGLPNYDEITAALDEKAIPFEAYGDGWLYHWLPFMLLKGHLVAESAIETAQSMDRAFNELLRERDRRAPHYRRMLLLRPKPESLNLPVLQPAGDTAADLRRLVRLSVEVSAALVRGQDPVGSGSTLRAWITDAGSDEEPIATAASSLLTALDAVRDASVVTLPPLPDPPPAQATLGVTLVVVNLNGAEHLPAFLDSVAAQTYPRDLTRVVLVDNGSTDGSLELIANRYPWVEVHPQKSNLGFAPAVNVGVRASSTELVAFANNDMRLDPKWIEELVRAYDPAEGVICVAGQILSWDGERLDFGEGSMSFYGMGSQIGYGEALANVHVRNGGDLLFACGGSMLISRDVYLATGGFDDGFFAYFEDVDFGWRLWVLGYRVRMAANAVSFHRMHGTSGRFHDFQRMLLYERNALRTVIKNYDDHNLGTVLGPALLLLVKRAVLRGGLDRRPFDIGAEADTAEPVTRMTLSHFHAVADVVDDLDSLLEARRAIQKARRRRDDEILPMFGRPFLPVDTNPAFLEAQHAIVRGFELDHVFRQRATRLLVISSDLVGEKMRGPAIRALEIGKALATLVDVRVAVPGGEAEEFDGVSLVGYTDENSLRRHVEVSDVILVQGYTLRRFPGLAATNAVLVVDLYDPWVFENLELHASAEGGDAALRQDVSVINELLDKGDYFICASERQRDFLIGMLTARGRLDSTSYEYDRSLRSLVGVVPFGLPSREARRSKPVLKGVHPGIAEDDLVVLWGGGTWDWFDPLSVLEAFARVVQHVPNAKLYFLGLQLQSDDVAPMKMADLAVERAEQLGLAGTSVFFGDWAPYHLREAYLIEADVAVSAARDLAETRLAFRSRILDYLWAGLPVVATSGDVLSDIVHEERAGVVVPPGDVGAMAHALVTLLGDPVRRATCAARAREVAARFTWDKTVEPLHDVVLRPWLWRAGRQGSSRGRVLTEDGQMLVEQRDLEIATLREALDGAAETAATSAARIHDLEGIVAHKDRPYAVLRRTPVYTVVGWWRRRRRR